MSVYDLAPFARTHPGGQGMIRNLAGTDGTVPFSSVHSPGILVGMEGHVVGRWRGDNRPATSPGNEAFVDPEQLRGHGSPDDCWLALHGWVYDLSSFAKSHPGGEKLIHSLAGKDGTNAFSSVHSPGMLAGMEEHIVGRWKGHSSRRRKKRDAAIDTGELRRHDAPDDCWVALYGRVYDLSSVASNHPGGAALIHALAGRDGTDSFSSAHGPGILAGIEDHTVGRWSPLHPDGDRGVPASAENNPSAAGSGSGDQQLPRISLHQLYTHNRPSDAWVALAGTVYDLTKFAERHPGGEDVIHAVAGRGGTEQYMAMHKNPTRLLRGVCL